MAPNISGKRLHFSRNISGIGAEYLAVLLLGLRHSETVLALFSRTDSESFFLDM